MCGIAEVLINLGYARAGLGHEGQPVTSWLTAQLGARDRTRARGGEYRRRRCGGGLERNRARQPGSRRRARASGFRWSRAPKCSPSSCASVIRLRWRARMARRRRPAWWPAFWPRAAKIRPSSSVACLKSAGSNARLGTGRYLVAEADESDASFTHLQPLIAIVTNIDNDHLATHGGDFELLKESFVEFLHNLPFYGLAVLCIDDENVRSILRAGRPADSVLRTAQPAADVRAENIRRNGLQTTSTSCARRARRSTVTVNLPGTAQRAQFTRGDCGRDRGRRRGCRDSARARQLPGYRAAHAAHRATSRPLWAA